MKRNRVLVIRNDKIGDFMLAWPVFALLKHHWPEASISVLVPDYTAELARLCPWIDEVIVDEGENALLLSRKLRSAHIDAMLTLFSTARVAIAGMLARIPYRLAPATKVAQIFYNHRLVQRRSRSEKPEYVYNMDLALKLLQDFGVHGEPLVDIERPLLKVKGSRVEAGLPEERRLIFIHPGSGGSANTLRAEQYAELANGIGCDDCYFIVTAGPGEEENAQAVINGIGEKAMLFSSAGSLNSLVMALAHADLFISGSTGPLHIAAALDRPTAAFYPRRRSATPLRWQTTNAPEKRLAFTPPETAAAEDVQACDIGAAVAAIRTIIHASA